MIQYDARKDMPTRCPKHAASTTYKDDTRTTSGGLIDVKRLFPECGCFLLGLEDANGEGVIR